MNSMLEINTAKVPEYLLDIVPNKHETLSWHNVRNREHLIAPICTVELFKNYFVHVPEALKHWNLSNVETREATSISSFRIDY